MFERHLNLKSYLYACRVTIVAQDFSYAISRKSGTPNTDINEIHDTILEIPEK